MKLVLKNGNEINITRANNMYSFDSLKDGLGCDMNKNTVSTIVIFNPDKTFDQIREMLSGDNREDFKIVYGNTEKTYTNMKIESVSEEISNERSIISIELSAVESNADSSTEEITEETVKETTEEKA